MSLLGKITLSALMTLTASSASAVTTAYRGKILHFVADPRIAGEQAMEFYDDGVLVVDNGKVVQTGSYQRLQEELAPKISQGKLEFKDYSDKLILPGFIDTHIHYPQTEMVAAYGEQLLEWLNTYTFPTERKYKNYAHALSHAKFFLDQLLRNGTTTALVFATVYPESVDALFNEALAREMRIIGGKVMMDRNAPDYLRDTPSQSYADSKALIAKWHGKGRLLYAVTPRFAPTSTPEQLKAAGKLLAEHPTVYLHTHLSENPAEVAWVKELFPERSGYFDVYDYFGLTGSRSIFAHSIHLTNEEIQRMAVTHSVASFCPTSNLFLGSGLFKLYPFLDHGIRVGLGTDIGAGTSFSMLQTLNEAYKVVQLQKQKLSAMLGFYLATLGGAKALSLDDRLGNFAPGKEADFVVLDPTATPLLDMRIRNSRNLTEKLFVLMKLGDDRTVRATYVNGKLAYEATSQAH